MNMQRQDMPEQLIPNQTVPHGIRNRALLPRHMEQVYSGYTYSDDSNDKFLSLAVRSEFTEE